MSTHSETYHKRIQYWNDILNLGKVYAGEYLTFMEQLGSEQSVKQHLFQDTILCREVKNFLTFDTCPDRSVYEKEIMEKAEISMAKGVFLPLEYLCRVFRLNPFERFCITLLTASQLNSEFEKFYAYMNNDWQRDKLSLELAIDMYRKADHNPCDFFACFSEESVLVRHFIDLASTHKEYLLQREIRLKPVIEDFLFHEVSGFQALRDYTEYVLPGEKLPPILSENKPYQHILQYLSQERKETAALFYLYGERGSEKKLNIKYLAGSLHKSVVFLNVEKLAKARAELSAIMKRIVTEAILQQSLLCVYTKSHTLNEDYLLQEFIMNIVEEINREIPILFLVSDDPKKINVTPKGTTIIAIETGVYSLEENAHFWTELAKSYCFEDEVILSDFANKFTLSPGQIAEIYEEAKSRTLWYGLEKITLPIMQKVCFEKLEHNLGKKAQKVKLMYRWDDLVLPDYQRNLLKVACDQIIYKTKVFSEWGYDEKIAYGTGLSMIFSGSPGTGKTMAAQVIARELGLELYKIELASVVSKYIGETERNLNEIFEEAKKSQSIVFFDEADVLFSKRSEVKDSNDKYSNMEAAFMLQKIEDYRGIVILATNFVQNIDEAFKRRIKFLIDFPFPDRQHRTLIWRNVFPQKLPVSKDVDFDFLAARFELSGSNIKNIALNAAFLAAASDTSVSMPHIIKAVANEFRKSGKKLSKEDFGEYFMDA